MAKGWKVKGCLPVTFWAVLLLLYTNSINQSVAFDSAGHEAISMTAISGLTTDANQSLQELLHGHDLADVAGWAHRVSAKYPETGVLHFQPSYTACSDEKEMGDSIDLYSCKGDNHCMLRSLYYFFYHLVDPSMNESAQMASDQVINTSDFKFPMGMKITDADAVKYLINLIGDMHEPFHMGHSSDSYGKDIYLTYMTSNGARTVSAFEFMEKSFIDKIIEERQYFWSSGWTHINSIKSTFDEERATFERDKERSFLRWAKENRKILCNDIYKLIKGLPKAQGKSNTFLVDKAAEILLFDLVKRRILLAGSRIAIALNYILKSRSHEGLGTLAAGSGIQGVRDTAEQMQTPHPDNYYNCLQNFLINFSIFVIIMILFFILSRCFSSSPTHHPIAGSESDPKAMREMKET